MARNALQKPFMQDEEQAFKFFCGIRWPEGIVCPFCQHAKVYALVRSGRKNRKTGERGPDRRLLKCARCRKQFSPTVDTVFEDSHIPLATWMNAFYLLCSSKKGMSSHQLHRMLGVTYKTAWFMTHRIRYAMGQLPAITDKLQGIVEVDETYMGGKGRVGRGAIQGSMRHKTPVVSLVERHGRVRSMVLPTVTGANLKQAIRNHVDPSARVMTDESRLYKGLSREFASHETVNHFIHEYARGDVHSNTVESFFSLLKRGINGSYHHVSREHLHRYLAEFDFRYNLRSVDDMQRYMAALKATEGKRLQYRSVN